MCPQSRRRLRRQAFDRFGSSDAVRARQQCVKSLQALAGSWSSWFILTDDHRGGIDPQRIDQLVGVLAAPGWLAARSSWSHPVPSPLGFPRSGSKPARVTSPLSKRPPQSARVC